MHVPKTGSRSSTPPAASKAELQSAHEEQASKVLEGQQTKVKDDQFTQPAETDPTRKKHDWLFLRAGRSARPDPQEAKRYTAIKAVNKMLDEAIRKQSHGNFDLSFSLMTQAITGARANKLDVSKLFADRLGDLANGGVREAQRLQSEGHFQSAFDTATKACKVAACAELQLADLSDVALESLMEQFMLEIDLLQNKDLVPEALTMMSQVKILSSDSGFTLSLVVRRKGHILSNAITGENKLLTDALIDAAGPEDKHYLSSACVAAISVKDKDILRRLLGSQASSEKAGILSRYAPSEKAEIVSRYASSVYHSRPSEYEACVRMALTHEDPQFLCDLFGFGRACEYALPWPNRAFLKSVKKLANPMSLGDDPSA